MDARSSKCKEHKYGHEKVVRFCSIDPEVKIVINAIALFILHSIKPNSCSQVELMERV
jgi:hypothetical protein